MPVKLSVWLNGDLGRQVEQGLAKHLAKVSKIRVSRLPRALLVEGDEAHGVLLELVHRAVLDLEQDLQRSFPVFHHELGPLWTGSLQVLWK